MSERDAIVTTDVFALYPIPGGPTVAALRGLSLRVPAGERLVVHGPNGSGKTTLLRLLSGELAPSSGQLSVAGHELSVPDRRAAGRLRRDVLGLVAQHSGRALRPELTVLDNVALQLRVAGRPRHAARTIAAEVLDDLGLGEFGRRRPATLSGGEAQRVAVCAAVAHRPRVLLADEPTGELDAASADLVYDLLAASAEHTGATLVLVTHDAHAARIASRVVRIRDGRLSEQWDPAHPDDEQLVLDPAGWLRLPERVRARAGAATAVRVGERNGVVELRGTGEPPPTPATPPALPGPLDVDAHALGAGPAAERLAAPGRAASSRPARPRGLRRHRHGHPRPVRFGQVHAAAVAARPRRPRRRFGRTGRTVAGWARPRCANGTAPALRRRQHAVRRARRDRRRPREPAARAAYSRPADHRPRVHRHPRRTAVGPRPHRPGRPAGATAVRRRTSTGGNRALDRRPTGTARGRRTTSQQDERHAAGTAAALAAAAAAGTAVVCATHDDVVAAVAGVIVDLV